MICAVNSTQTRRRFEAALADPRSAGVACQLGALQAVFGPLPGSGWRFYTGGEGEPSFALGVRGTSALLAGPADAEELAGFLGFCGVQQLRTTAAVPKGWQPKERFVRMILPSALLAGPADAEELAGFLGFCGVQQLRTTAAVPKGWQPKERFVRMILPTGATLPRQPAPEKIRLNECPGVGQVTDLLCRGESLGSGAEDARDCFYSETCTLVNHGRALIWAAQAPEGELVATAGAYALWNQTAYLAGVETLQGNRGRGVGRFLVCALANRLAGQGNTVELLCTPERAGFYRALGFEREGEDRGRGVGRFLVCALANRLAGQGNTVELLCTPERAGFYRALGFEREGEVGSFGP